MIPNKAAKSKYKCANKDTQQQNHRQNREISPVSVQKRTMKNLENNTV